MILVDTSVWVDHLRSGNATLAQLLDRSHVVTHPFVIGELALGNLANHSPVLRQLQSLPEASEATHEEVLTFIDRHSLSGLGIGYVDVHLLAAAKLAGDALWTFDKRLHAAATALDLAWKP